MWVVEMYRNNDGCFGLSYPRLKHDWTKTELRPTPYKYILLDIVKGATHYQVWRALTFLTNADCEKLYSNKNALTANDFMLQLQR